MGIAIDPVGRLVIKGPAGQIRYRQQPDISPLGALADAAKLDEPRMGRGDALQIGLHLVKEVVVVGAVVEHGLSISNQWALYKGWAKRLRPYFDGF